MINNFNNKLEVIRSFLGLIILMCVFFIVSCKKSIPKSVPDIYNQNKDYLESMIDKNNVLYDEEQVYRIIDNIYICNELLGIMGRVFLISDISDSVEIKNVHKVSGLYVICFPTSTINFALICNEYGCITNMIYYKKTIPSFDLFLNYNEHEQIDTLLEFGLSCVNNSYISEVNDEQFIEILFNNGNIYNFYIDIVNNDYTIKEYKKICHIDEDIINYLLK